MKLNKIIQSLEEWAPSIYQESYDNSGLIIGDINSKVSGCLITLDCTEEVVDEAIKKNCNLIISHHPILFKSINRINFNTWESRVIKKSVKNDINIYALHTNLDNVSNGVNKKICDILQMDNTEILRKKENISCRLDVYIPEKNKDEFLKKIFETGGGIIGNYNECSFQIHGNGTFLPNDQAKPKIGKKNKKETIDEIKNIEKNILTVPGKLGLNAFINTSLDEVLKKNNIEEVILAGTVASICIDSTGRSAFEKGYKVTMLQDCISSRSIFENDFYFDNVFPLYATVKSSTEI